MKRSEEKGRAAWLVQLEEKGTAAWLVQLECTHSLMIVIIIMTIMSSQANDNRPGQAR